MITMSLKVTKTANIWKMHKNLGCSSSSLNLIYLNGISNYKKIVEHLKDRI